MLMPEHVGGGPDDPTRVYRVLRSAVGQGGSAPDESGIDGLWRRARALGLSAATSATRRAFFNAFPARATDMLMHYERALGLLATPGVTEAERREIVVALWHAKPSAVVRDVQTELQSIDARFTLELVPEARTTTSWDGRWFAGGEEPTFGGSGWSTLAAPTTRYMATAFLAVTDPGTLTEADERAVLLAQRKLRSLLPSWEDFAVSVSSVGFLCDESPLDWTVLGDG